MSTQSDAGERWCGSKEAAELVAEALRATGALWSANDYYEVTTDADEFAAAILATMPNWMLVPSDEMIGTRALATALEEKQAEIKRLRAALSFHNKTPTGMTRKCLPGCIACAALAPEAERCEHDWEEGERITPTHSYWCCAKCGKPGPHDALDAKRRAPEAGR